MLPETQKAIEHAESETQEWSNACHAWTHATLALVHEISEQNRILNVCAKHLEKIANNTGA